MLYLLQRIYCRFFLMLSYFINEMILGIFHKLSFWTPKFQTFFNKTKILNYKILTPLVYIWFLTTTVNVFFEYYNATSLSEDFHSLLSLFFFIIIFIFFFSPSFSSSQLPLCLLQFKLLIAYITKALS